MAGSGTDSRANAWDGGLPADLMFVILTKRRQMFQPLIDILDQAAWVVVDIDTRRDVHGRYQHHAFLNTTLAEDLFHLRRNMHVGAMRLGMKVQIFGEGLHYRILRARSLNIVSSKSTAKADRSFS